MICFKKKKNIQYVDPIISKSSMLTTSFQYTWYNMTHNNFRQFCPAIHCRANSLNFLSSSILNTMLEASLCFQIKSLVISSSFGVLVMSCIHHVLYPSCLVSTVLEANFLRGSVQLVCFFLFFSFFFFFIVIWCEHFSYLSASQSGFCRESLMLYSILLNYSPRFPLAFLNEP